MQKYKQFTAIIEREGNGYGWVFSQVMAANDKNSVEEARNNLTEALEMFFEHASESEIRDRLHNEIFITRLEVAVA